VQDDYGDTTAISRNILAHDLKFPGLHDDLPEGAEGWVGAHGEAAKDLVTKLLQVEPSGRLGSLRGGTEDIKEHSWFSGEGISEGPCSERLAWQVLLERKIAAPWIPEIR
jgi:hypothetical protein